MITRDELIRDSCDAGRYRGGLGVRHEYERPYAGAMFTILSDGRRLAPWRLLGSGAGQPARFIYDPDGEHRLPPPKHTLFVPTGGQVLIYTPGGGFDDPHARDRWALARGLQDDKVTEAWAAAVNG